MTDDRSVSGSVCRLHRDVLEARIGAIEHRQNDLAEAIEDIRGMHRQILAGLIYVSFAVSLILLGILLGQGLNLVRMMP